MHTLAVLVKTHGEQLQLLGRRHRPVHGLVQNLDREATRLGEVGQLDLRRGIVVVRLHLVSPLLLLLRAVIRLQQALPGLVVRAYDRGLPAAVVPRRVALVQLEAVRLVVPREQERHAERAEAAVLRVRLLVIAHVLDQVLYGYRLLVLVCVPARAEPGLVDQYVGVGRQAGYRAGRVRTELVRLF